MFLLNGKPLPLDTPFTTPDGTQYPANWLRLASLEEKEAIGIDEVPDPQYYDERFYWGYDQEGNLIPKDHSQLVELWVSTTRTTAGTLLSPTDWMVVRQIDNGTEMDANTKSWRESIRVESNNKVEKIKTTNNTDELASYITSEEYSFWPTLE